MFSEIIVTSGVIKKKKKLLIFDGPEKAVGAIRQLAN